MIARFIVGGIVVYPTCIFRLDLNGFLWLVTLALAVALVIPEDWHD